MHQASIAKLLLGTASIVGLVAAVGCAVGTDPATGVSDIDSVPVEAGQADETSVVLPPSTKPSEDAGTDDDAGGDGGTEHGGTTDGGSEGGTDAGVDSGGGGGGGVSCASPNSCASATDLGTINGDTGADFKTATGVGSQWFKIRVNENDSSISPVTLLTKAELTSPPGTNFDVFLYVAGGSSGQECSAVKSSSTSTGTFDSTTAEWGETGIFSNGSDDSRTVSVEVRWISGTCSPSAKWSLTVRGDTP